MQFLQGIISSLVPPGSGTVVAAGIDYTPAGAAALPFPQTTSRAAAPAAGPSPATRRPGPAAAPRAGNAADQPPLPPQQPQQLAWMVPHLIATVDAYLQRLQAPDFNPGPAPLSSLLPAPGSPTDDQLTTLTESIQNVLGGAYLPQPLQALLNESYEDTVGRVAAAPARGATGASAPAAGASAPASSMAAVTTAEQQSAPREGAAAAAAAASREGGGGGGRGAAAEGGRGGRGRGRGAAAQQQQEQQQQGGRLRYRYTPLAVAALSELVRRADLHLASSLQPMMRELGVALTAGAGGAAGAGGVAGAGSTHAATRSLAQHLQVRALDSASVWAPQGGPGFDCRACQIVSARVRVRPAGGQGAVRLRGAAARAVREGGGATRGADPRSPFALFERCRRGKRSFGVSFGVWALLRLVCHRLRETSLVAPRLLALPPAVLQASAALLAELSRVASAVSLAVSGNVAPLALNTAAALQPDGAWVSPS